MAEDTGDSIVFDAIETRTNLRTSRQLGELKKSANEVSPETIDMMNAVNKATIMAERLPGVQRPPRKFSEKPLGEGYRNTERLRQERLKREEQAKLDEMMKNGGLTPTPQEKPAEPQKEAGAQKETGFTEEDGVKAAQEWENMLQKAKDPVGSR